MMQHITKHVSVALALAGCVFAPLPIRPNEGRLFFFSRGDHLAVTDYIFAKEGHKLLGLEL